MIRISRRAALAGSAALAIAGATVRSTGTAHGAGGPFRLTGAGTPLFTAAPLHDATVLQSFAFDDRRQDVYTVQLMAGGNQLPGEPAPVSGAERDAAGDLCLSRLALDGTLLGHMYLTGFGHGVQIGCQPDDDGARLWTEIEADNEGGKSGWGTRVGCFGFRDGHVLPAGHRSIRRFDPVAGADRTTVSTDVAHRRMIIRHRVDGAFRYAAFPLGRPTGAPLFDVAQPQLPATFQGFASYGRYLYLLTGDHDSETIPSPPGNTSVTTVDLTDGRVVEQTEITAVPELDYREPEGLAIRLSDPDDPTSARLCVGFASGVVGDRRATIVALEHR